MTDRPHDEDCDTKKPDGEDCCMMRITSKTPIGTIDCTPSWAAVVGFYIEVIQTSADPAKRADAKAEILRAAKLADLYVKEHKR